MRRLDVLFTMDCEAINDLAAEGGPRDWELCKKAMGGYCETLLKRGFKTTLFVVPCTANKTAAFLRELQGWGAELGLHLHPQDHGYADYLGGYTLKEQQSMLEEACKVWSEGLGFRPQSFRGGNFSANDATFPALMDCGFRQGSLSVPGRSFTRVKSNWAGGSMQPYHAHPANRLLPGTLDFLEIPVTADWESVMWGGLTKLELRLEMVDARSHGFTIRKNVDRQLSAGVEHPYLLALTHNIFDYTDPAEFRRQVLDGVLDEIDRYAGEKELQRTGFTLAAYHEKADQETQKGGHGK